MEVDQASSAPTQASSGGIAAHASNGDGSQSKKDCRVWAGNLAYEVRSEDLADYLKSAGNIVHCDVLSMPNGYSKGCGIVEFSTPEEAQNAIATLNDTQLMGRPIFIREDREAEARFGGGPRRGGSSFGGGGRGGSFAGRNAGGYNNSNGFNGGPAVGGSSDTQLYIGNLPYSTGWQDLKDLFRNAGQVVRADINMGYDGRSKGSGIVVFASAEDAQNAISQYNGYEWGGRSIEVREDRFAGSAGGGGGFAGGRGGFGSGRGGFAVSRGGFAGGFNSARGGFGGGQAAAFPPAEPSQQIFVKNLPWSTSNEDLVELFQTTGRVQEAEVLFDNGRSKGVGVVQFASVGDAETSIAKFQGYMYGGRPLDLEFNRSWRNFHGAAGQGEVLMG